MELTNTFPPDLGPVGGLTLTVPVVWGVILIAILALVVKWAGTHFWGILCFILHDLRSTQASQDGLHYQHQALLRSKTPETELLWRLYEISWAWRSSTSSSFRRSIPLALLAIVNLVAFLIAGIFSARVTVTNSEGLLVGLCGWLASTADKDFPLWTQDDWAAGDALFVSAYNGYRQSLTYTQTCYTSNILNSSDAQCKFPDTPYIESTINRDADCPFGSEVCTGRALTIDSGLINSDTQLGINADPGNRLQVRKKTSCAPFDMDVYSSGWTQDVQPGTEMFFPAALPNDTYKYYSLGSSWLYGAPISNFTFVRSNYSLYINGLPYTFDVRTAYAKNFTESGFLPDSQFNRTDADVSILVLNNRVAYTGRVDDPFYQATLPAGGNRLAEAWISNMTLTGLACTEQYQFCNPARSESPESCTPLGALYDFDWDDPPTSLSLNARQSATYRMLRSMIYYMRFNSFLMFLKNEILVANKLVYGSFGISSPLPPTSWQQEIENIHNLSLAGMQLNSIAHAANSDVQIREGLRLSDYIIPETDPESLALCKNQRVRVTTYSSFSMLGILIILIVSTLIILVDTYLPGLVHRLQRTSMKGDIARQAWDEDDILQIQRLALEGRGVGPWKQKTGGVPVTAGWDIKFRRDKLYASSGKTGLFVEEARSLEAFEPLTGHGNGYESERGGSAVELMQTPQSRVFRTVN